MTGPLMISSFLQYYDRVTNFSAPGYEDSEILLFLNNAQDEFIRSILFGKDNQSPVIPGNRKLETDLYPLMHSIIFLSGTSTAGWWPNHKRYLLNSLTYPMQYFIGFMVEMSRTNPTVTTTEFISCDVIDQKDADKFAWIPGVNKPHFIKPVCWLSNISNIGDKIINFMYDAYSTLDKSTLTYTATPKPITATIGEFNNTYDPLYMSLPPHTHQSIVDIAVRQALQAIQDQRYQSKIAEQQIKNE
jgi:hypothetical protein